MAEDASRRRRGGRWWPIFTFVILLVAIASDERDHLRHLANMDRAIADAVGSVSISSLYDDYAERINSCDYAWLVICAPKNDSTSLFDTTPVQQPSGGMVTYVASAVTNIPKLPDATFYALGKRWHQGWVAFTLSVLFLAGCILFVVVCVGERNYVGAFFVPVFMLLVMWVLKHVFLLFASGALLFLEALILLGGIPALLAVCIKFFHESREVKEGVAEVVHTFKGT